MPHRGTPPPVVTRRLVIGVMGSGRESHAHLSAPLGTWLATTGCHLLTGGGRGVMEMVSKTFSEAEGREGMIIGVVPALPGSQHEDNIVPPAGYPNAYTEIVIRTQCPLSMHPLTGTELSSRNHINILSSDVVVALPGSSGTWSEIQLAIRYRKPLILFLGEEGGEIELALDEELEDIRIAKSLEEVKEFVLAALEKRRQIIRAHAVSFAAQQQEAALRREASQSNASVSNSTTPSPTNATATATATGAAAATDTSTSNGAGSSDPAAAGKATPPANGNGSGSAANGVENANPASADGGLDGSSSSAVAVAAAAATMAATTNGNPSS